jgi:thioester reductase-like protein
MSVEPWDPVSWTPGAPYEPPKFSRFAPVDGADPLRVHNRAGAKWTKQSSVAEPYGAGHFARPTRFEANPWWTIDLASAHALEAVRLRLAPLPEGAAVTLTAYTYAAVDGAAPHNAPSLTVALSAFATEADGARSIELSVDWVARFVRVSVTLDGVTQLSLGVRSFSVDASDLYGETLRESYQRAFSRFADRTLFSERSAPGEGPFVPTHTYRSLWSLSLQLATALARKLEPVRGERVFLGVMTGHRPEWFAAELAAVHRGYVMVALSPEDSDERLDAILQRCPLDAVLCDRAGLAKIEASARRPRLIVALDGESSGEILSFRALLEAPGPEVSPAAPRAATDLHAVIFTSGSTGTPKGAMRSYGRFNDVIASYGAGQPSFHLSFQPLSHLSERNYLPAAVLNGAHVGLSSGAAHVLSDIEAFEPTWLSSVPRLFEAAHAIHEQRLSRQIAENPAVDPSELERRALAETRAKFGGRLQGVSVGSAPVSDALLRFLQKLFAGLWVQTGYGTTEVGTIAGSDLPVANVHVKIVALDELGPDPEGVVRGELWVRTPHLIDGYLDDPESTARSFDSEGYFCTGDIVERYGVNSLRVIGRRSNSVKLASGEFVSLDRVESVLAASSLVQSVLVSLDRRRASLVAVVVPHHSALCALLNTSDSIQLDVLIADPLAAGRVLSALRDHCERAGLSRFERPSAVVLDHRPFTVESGLLTTSAKLARRAAEARYRAQIDALDVSAPAAMGADGSPLGRALAAASSVVGRAVSADEPLHDSALARDSLVAAELIATVGAALGRELSLRAWSEAKTLRALIEPSREPATLLDVLRAELATDVPARFAPGDGGGVREVLLTGATGFIGAHALEALLSETGATVRCLVRAADDREARARVEATLARYAITGLPADRWEALAGDAAHERPQAIVHCAAAVNWLATWETVRESNVGLTRRMLALAAERGAELHYVSTVSVAASDGDETTALELERAALQSGYGASKWAAEMLVKRAMSRGLRACVYRPGLVTGHSLRGIGNRDDFVHRYLAACAKYGVALDHGAVMDTTPVDYVCLAIARSVGLASAMGRVVHVNNARGSMTFARLAESARRAGVRCAGVGYEAFRERAVKPADSPLRALSGYFTDAGFYLGSGPWPDEASRAWLATLGVSCPAADDALIERYLRGLKVIA